MLQVNFEPLCAILILSRNSSPQCKSFSPYKPCSHLHTFVSYCSCWCLQKEKKNLYLNLFLNISFVLINIFCYNHATVIENIVYTRSIMYLPFAIFSVEMNYYHFDQFFFSLFLSFFFFSFFLGWCVQLVDVSSFSNCCICAPHFHMGKNDYVC